MIRIDREGVWLTAVLLAVIAILLTIADRTGIVVFDIVAMLVFPAMGFTLYFFRDPERFGSADEYAAISAADGVVVDVSRGADEDGVLRIAVFMNVFNVHVNRTPVEGTVVATSHNPGRKLNAMSPRAADENEYGEIEIESPYGNVRVRQIAGLIARRVVTRVQADDRLHRGDRIGLIRFGSRVDVYLPVAFEPVVRVGDRVRAGETVIAELPVDRTAEGMTT